MLLLNYNHLRSCNQIELCAYVDKNNFNNIQNEEFENSEKIIFRFFELNENISKILKRVGIKKHFFMGENFHYYDYLSYKSFILRNLLSWWNLGIQLERDEFGTLTEECFKRVSNVHPCLLNHFLDAYDEAYEIADVDNQKIIDQCHSIFRRGSKGITDADESISTYCNLTVFWEKLGLNYFDIQKLPDDLFNKLNLIIRKDNEIQVKEFEKMNTKSSGSGGNIIGSYNF